MTDPAAAARRCLHAALLILLAVGIAVMHAAPPLQAQAMAQALVSPATGNSMAMPSAPPPMPEAEAGATALRSAATSTSAAMGAPAPPAAPMPVPCGHPGRLVCLSTLPQPAAPGGLLGLLTLLTLAVPAGAAWYPRTSPSVTDGASLDCRPPPPDLFALGVLRT